MKYPYATLRVGESFFAPVDVIDITRMKRLTGNLYTQRKVTEHGTTGIRVWRIA